MHIHKMQYSRLTFFLISYDIRTYARNMNYRGIYLGIKLRGIRGAFSLFWEENKRKPMRLAEKIFYSVLSEIRDLVNSDK